MQRITRPGTSSSAPTSNHRVRAIQVVGSTATQKSAQNDEPHEDAENILARPRRAPPSPQVGQEIDVTTRLTRLLALADDKLREQLLIASEKGKRHAVYLLLHQGVVSRDRCRGMRGFSPLHHAAMRGHLDVLQLLVEFGWNIDVRNDAMETPLHLSCYSGHASIVEFLLDKGAHMNATTSDGETPLFYAARKNHYRIVRLLIRRECDLSIQNRYGDIAQDEATTERTLGEFAVGNEDLDRLYRRPTQVAKSPLLFRGEIALSQTQRERILSFLDLKSLCRASQSCYRWHRASDNTALWRQLGVSRWELQLQTTVGIGAVAPMRVLGAGGLQLNMASFVGSVRKGQRPSSCDQARSSFFPARRSSGFVGDTRRPQTARTGTSS